MSFSFEHRGAHLPIVLPLGQVSGGGDCPSCVRAGLEGHVSISVSDDAGGSGSVMALCTRGHMVLVQWERGSD